jgi:hypothetical protein
MYPKNDELCASMINKAIRESNESRAAASSSKAVDIRTMNRERNQVYTLRQKMFGPYLPNRGTEQSRTLV